MPKATKIRGIEWTEDSRHKQYANAEKKAMKLHNERQAVRILTALGPGTQIEYVVFTRS